VACVAAGVREVQARLSGLGQYRVPYALGKIDAILEYLGIEDAWRKAARTWMERETQRLFTEGARKEQIDEQPLHQWQALGARCVVRSQGLVHEPVD
jgi:hypothetical protein